MSEPVHVWYLRWSRWFELADPSLLELEPDDQLGYYVAASATTRGMYQSTAVCKRDDPEGLKHEKRMNAYRSLVACVMRHERLASG